MKGTLALCSLVLWVGVAAYGQNNPNPLESQRALVNQYCAGCHNRIDPLGFALENFDVIGRWRDQDAGKPVDNSGELPDGTKFQGPDELKAVLLSQKDVFIRNLTSKMLGYALGRGLTLKDSCAIDNIAARLKDNDYSAQTLIDEIVLSAPFRYQAAGAPGQEELKKP